MVDLLRDFWISETGMGQQVAQLHEKYMMMMIISYINYASSRLDSSHEGKIQWKAPVNMVINLWVLSKVGNILTTRDLNWQEFCAMELIRCILIEPVYAISQLVYWHSVRRL